MQKMRLTDFGAKVAIRELKKSEVSGVLFHADNEDILARIGLDLAGQVRCIYIDPPYRNGDSYFHYQDTLNHEEWVSFMSRILPSLYALLRDDGSIWISIDDEEMAYLKVLCDTIFGRVHFVANIIWEHRVSRENRSIFSHNHEYILVYAKDPCIFKKTRNLIESRNSISKFKNPDNDPRGPWQSVTATAQAGHSVPSQFYEIVSPVTGKVYNPPKGRCWVYNEQRMLNEIESGNIWFGSDGNGVPRIKRFLTNSNSGVVPSTLWKAEDVGTTKDAKKHVLELSDAHEVFDTPKPESLVKRILDIATDEGDIVVDAFLGSGTTAAVSHKMNRRYVGIEKESSSFRFSKRRIKAVIEGEQKGISSSLGWKGGGTCLTVEPGSDANSVWVPAVVGA